MASTTELILKFTGDRRQLAQVIAAVRGDLSGLSTSQVAAVRNASQQTLIETTKSEKARVAETIKAANQRLKEEQRAAREVARIVAETTRQADRQEKVRERAAKQLANVQIREAKRAAKELEKSLTSSSGGGDISGTISSLGGSIPVLGRLTSQFANVSTAAAGAGGAIAAAAVPIGLLVAGATAGVAVLTLLGKALFDAAKEAADFQGKFLDLSQQVGVSVETLSTLDIAASTTGGNIETVSASLAIFQKNLENAHDPTSEEAKLLKDLGVTTLNTEVAFRQAIKGLFALGETSKQTDSVLTLFGRSGRFVNAIMKEGKGDIDAYQQSIKQLVVSLEAAKAADQFNDSLEILNRTFATITRSLVSDTIPVFIVLFEEVSQGLTGNVNAWQSWGKIIEIEIAGVIGIFKTLVQFIASRGTIDLESALAANIEGILKAAERVRNKIKFEADAERLIRSAQAFLAGRPGDRPDADKARSEAQARAAKRIQLQQKDLEESTRLHRENLERERDKDLKNIDEWQTEAIDAADKHRIEQNKLYDEELANARRFITNREDLLLAETEILQKRIKTTNDTVTAIQKINDEAQKKRDQVELTLNQQLLKTRDAMRAKELQEIKSDLDQGLIAESGAILHRMALLKQEFEDRNVLRGIELEQLTTSAARKTELDNDKIESEIKYTTEFKRLSEERIAALVREGTAATPGPGGRVPEGQPVPINVGVPPAPGLGALVDEAIQAEGVFAGLGVAISDALGLGQESAVAFASTITESFGLMASAVGDAVKAFLLFGTAQGSFRKFAAEIIASVAQMAIVQAIWEGAQGLAMLALTWFTGNPKYAQSASAHFAAAATYGLIAAAAAPAARLLAGNEFAQQGAGGTAGGGGGGSSNATSSTGQPVPVELDRNTRNQQAIILNVNVKRDAGSIVEVTLDDHRNNGPIRQMILSELK